MLGAPAAGWMALAAASAALIPPASMAHKTTTATRFPMNGLPITFPPKLTTALVGHLSGMVTWQREAGKGTA